MTSLAEEVMLHEVIFLVSLYFDNLFLSSFVVPLDILLSFFFFFFFCISLIFMDFPLRSCGNLVYILFSLCEYFSLKRCCKVCLVR